MTLAAAHAERSAPEHLRAHLLLQVDPGRTDELSAYLADVPGVVETAATSGAFDAVVEVDVPTERDLQLLLRAARLAPGLLRIWLCRTGAPTQDPVDAEEPGQAFHDWMPWASAMAANA